MWFAFSPVAAQRVNHSVEDVRHVLDVGLDSVLIAHLMLSGSASHTGVQFVEFAGI